MEIKTICTGTDPNICNAAVFKDGAYICDIVNRECTEYMNKDCELKQGFRKVFKDIRG